MEKLTTVQNERGDVCTYLVQDGKHTLFTFDSVMNRAYVETLQRTDYLNGWAYMVRGDGITSSGFMDAGDGAEQVAEWQNTQEHVDSLLGAE